MFDHLYNSEIVDIVAYGVDEFDYTPNLLGFGTSVGETGYLEMKFSRGTPIRPCRAGSSPMKCSTASSRSSRISRCP